MQTFSSPALVSFVTSRLVYNHEMIAAALAVFLVGLVIGSFLNVCIHRIPLGESVVMPRSRCPECRQLIRAWENIPVVSYLLLRGKCRNCGARISWVYPTVELVTGVVLTLLFLKYDLQSPFWVNSLFACLLIVLVFIDLFERLLPDVITLGGTAAGFLLAPLQSAEFLGRSSGILTVGIAVVDSYLSSLLGIIVGGGFLWAVAVLYLKLRKMEGMGFGDIKMMAMVGAFLGWQFAWMTILVGSLGGAVVGGLYIYLLGHGRRYELPFGSFLGAGSILVVLWGSQWVEWYFGTVFSS